ncbi:UNVERIFIED_CONTAM: hypothetical protein Scaly_1327500 [Sesamum calycinum]|uniref:Uncharacterized protein n=1 Tax=Sesamum calycinum TaxID=2727403 RepID=A0AAW2Q7J5_9LAMI
MSTHETVKHDANIHVFELNDTTRAISTICSSESLRDCEMAIRTVSEAWLNSHGDKAYYFLDQLLTGIDEKFRECKADHLSWIKLVGEENGEGNSCEKSRAASVLHYCIQADGSCRHYLAKNLKKETVGDPLEHSVYREEAVDAIVKALDCWVFDEKVQEQTARALSILGGHFSYSGEPEVETWLLRKAAINENTGNTLYTHMSEEDKTMEIWQKKTALALLTSGNRRLIAALSNAMAHSIPCLARASLATVCWISSALDSLGDKDLYFAACSILALQLTECLKDKTTAEEKILASFSLHNLGKGTDYFSWLSRLEKEEVLNCLHKISQVTWTAKELISVVTTTLSKDSFL